MPDAPRFVDDHLLRVGRTDFHYEHPLVHVPAGRLGIEKQRDLIEAYFELCAALRPVRIMELGIRRGGSTALLCELTAPSKIVSVELSAAHVEALDDYVQRRGLTEIARQHYGLDQADRPGLASVVADEFGGEPLDLVIDDASHQYEESRASFEVLFPCLRPGGLYVLEDWRWQNMVAAAAECATELSAGARAAIEQRMIEIDEGRHRPVVPMSRLVLEIALIRAEYPEVIAAVTIGPHWAVVERGGDDLDPANFALDSILRDDFHLLTSRS